MTTDVLMVGWGYPPDIVGGLDVHVSEVFERMPTDRVDMTLVLPERHAPDDPDARPVPVDGASFEDRASGLSGPVVDLAAEHDVVHTHDWFGFEPGLRAALASDVTWISTLHSLSSDRNVRPSQLELNVERRLVETADHLVAVSERLARDVELKHGPSPRVIPNGFSSVDPSGEVPPPFDADDPVAFFVGRHAEQKGLSHLLYGFSKVLRQRDARLVIGGEGPRTSQLRLFAELLEIEDRVHFAGYVPDDRLGDYYAAADAFVSPSLSEPFGLTIAEALSVDTPVVATDSGIEEQLPDDCLISARPHSDSIARGILAAFDRDGVPSYDPYTWDQCCEELAALYRSVS